MGFAAGGIGAERGWKSRPIKGHLALQEAGLMRRSDVSKLQPAIIGWSWTSS
jgi:hypothetical protein